MNSLRIRKRSRISICTVRIHFCRFQRKWIRTRIRIRIPIRMYWTIRIRVRIRVRIFSPLWSGALKTCGWCPRTTSVSPSESSICDGRGTRNDCPPTALSESLICTPTVSNPNQACLHDALPLIIGYDPTLHACLETIPLIQYQWRELCMLCRSLSIE